MESDERRRIIYKLVLEVPCDVRTARKALAGEPVAKLVGQRIREALKRWGVDPNEIA